MRETIIKKGVMLDFVNLAPKMASGSFEGVSPFVVIVMEAILVLMAILSVCSFFVSFYLAISYYRYNRTENSCGMSGEEVARAILDDNGLEHIGVSKFGSIIFGNSYSHYFKKVRLRRLTWKKRSVTSLAMAAQKSSLAILDDEGDEDMKVRIRLTPIIYVGPFAFVPLIVIGVLIDYFLLLGFCGILFTLVGLAVYIVSFVMSIKVLITEKKAQERAYEILFEEEFASDEEIEDCKKLFRLYNIEYVNNMIASMLELVYFILNIVANGQRLSSSED